MAKIEQCKQCKLDYDEHNPEWIRWCDIPGFCSDTCHDKFDKILQYGEDEYYNLPED